MSTHNKHKLQNLLKLWPMHTVAPVAWLKSLDYSRYLVQRYVKSGWVERLEHGTVIRAGDQVEWQGMVWGLQQLDNFYVGGKTALEVHGKGHFVKFKDTKIFMFSQPEHKLPKWMQVRNSAITFINTATNLFPDSVGIDEFSFGEFTLKISNPARAFCEYMHGVDKFHTYDEAYYLMENLQFLSPELMQETLEACTSIKVKRLVLCLARLQNTAWYAKLDKSKIVLGNGRRQWVKNGIYDTEYQITYPASWKEENSESSF